MIRDEYAIAFGLWRCLWCRRTYGLHFFQCGHCARPYPINVSQADIDERELAAMLR